MYKPSRFLNNTPLPQNIFLPHHLNKIQISNRYKLTKTLFRLQDYNFHLGVDLQTKSQIFAISILALQKEKKGCFNRKVYELYQKPIWKGEVFINKSEYYIDIYIKKGCFLVEYLTEKGTISSQNLFFIFALMVKFLQKNHASKINLKFIDIRALQIVENIEKKDLNFQICGSLSVMCQKAVEGNYKVMRTQKQNIKGEQEKHKVFTLNESEPKRGSRRDIEIIFQKIIEIEQEYISEQEGNLKFQNFISHLVDFIKHDKEKKGSFCQRITNYVNNFFQDNKIEISEEQQNTKETVNKIKSKNIKNLLFYCNEWERLMMGSSKCLFFQSDQQNSEEILNFSQQKSVLDLVENHILLVKNKMGS